MKKNNGKKKLIAGVLGGMGPLATVDFMSMVIDLCPIVTEDDHVRLLVDQNPHIPNRQIVSNIKSKNIGSMLADGALKLQNAGADFIVMPCNTAHMFSDDIKTRINIPFIHIVDETINENGEMQRQRKTNKSLYTLVDVWDDVLDESCVLASSVVIVIIYIIIIIAITLASSWSLPSSTSSSSLSTTSVSV